jgi:hypothetical protein
MRRRSQVAPLKTGMQDHERVQTLAFVTIRTQRKRRPVELRSSSTRAELRSIAPGLQNAYTLSTPGHQLGEHALDGVHMRLPNMALIRTASTRQNWTRFRPGRTGPDWLLAAAARRSPGGLRMAARVHPSRSFAIQSLCCFAGRRATLLLVRPVGDTGVEGGGDEGVA